MEAELALGVGCVDGVQAVHAEGDGHAAGERVGDADGVLPAPHGLHVDGASGGVLGAGVPVHLHGHGKPSAVGGGYGQGDGEERGQGSEGGGEFGVHGNLLHFPQTGRPGKSSVRGTGSREPQRPNAIRPGPNQAGPSTAAFHAAATLHSPSPTHLLSYSPLSVGSTRTSKAGL